MRMKIIRRLTFASLAVALWLPAQESIPKPASATPRNITIDDFFQIRDVSQPEMSPDGQWVVYSVRTRMLKDDKNEQRLWMVSTHSGDPIPMTAEGVSSSHPRWSPDGKYLAFLSSRNAGKSQVWLLNRLGGEAMRLTETVQGVTDFEWSPDSTRLILVLQDPKPEDAEAAKDKDKDAPAPKPKTPLAIWIGAAPTSTFLTSRPRGSPKLLPATLMTTNLPGRRTANLWPLPVTAAHPTPIAILIRTSGSSPPTTLTKVRTSRRSPPILERTAHPPGHATESGSPSSAKPTSRPSTTPPLTWPSLLRLAARRKS